MPDNFSYESLSKKSKAELLELAMEQKVIGSSKLNKTELINAILEKTNKINKDSKVGEKSESKRDYKTIFSWIGGYLIASWTFLQFLDWILKRNEISPYWTDLCLWILLGLLPTFLIYVFNIDRINQFVFKRWEKVVIPINLIVLGAVSFFMFRGSDLGATTKDVTYINADGVEETRNVVKNEFRKQLCIFAFEPIETDSIYQWIGKGMPDFLEATLEHNKYLSIKSYGQVDDLPKQMKALERASQNYKPLDKIDLAKAYREGVYIDGSYQVLTDGQLQLTTKIRDARNANIIKEKTITVSEIISGIDSITQYILYSVGLEQDQIDGSPMQSAATCLSDQVEALRHFAIARNGLDNTSFELGLERAIKEDTTFVMAYYDLAMNYQRFKINEYDRKNYINLAMKYRDRESYDDQMAILLLKYRIFQEDDKIEKLAKIQLSTDPLNPTYTAALSKLYFRQRRFEEFADYNYFLATKGFTPTRGFWAVQGSYMIGEYNKILRLLKPFSILDPNDAGLNELIAEGELMNGNYDKAQDIFENIILLAPELDSLVQPVIEAIDFLRNNPDDRNISEDILGDYRSSNSTQVASIIDFNNQFYVNFDHSGFFLFKTAKDKFARSGVSYDRVTSEFLRNKKGRVYLMKSDVTRSGHSWTTHAWKLDTLIRSAFDLLTSRDYLSAIPAFDKAISAHPEHIYLIGYLNHAKYMSSITEAQLKQQYQNLVGDYGKERTIKFKNDKLFYIREGYGSSELWPISENQYVSKSSTDVVYEADKEADKVLGLKYYLFDFDKMEYLPSEQYERKNILN